MSLLPVATTIALVLGLAVKGRVVRSWISEMSWSVKFAAFWLTITVLGAIYADWLPLKDPTAQAFLTGSGAGSNEGPSASFWFGTDALTRDIFSRVVYGAQVSIVVAVAAVACGVMIGGFLGSLVGYVRGKTDAVVMSAVDVILAFPGLVLLLALVTFLETRSLFVISVVIGALSIPPYTRVARANSLSVSRREYVLAARAIGTPRRTILFREVIPNVLPSVLAYALVAAAAIIVLEGSLAFLGLSVQPPTPTWGSMIYEGRKDIALALHPVFFPSAAMVLTVLSMNMVGDWLRKRGQHRGAAL